MDNKPKVSFCFTTYKRYEYLRSTLESVQRQTVSDFEVIVSDNDPEQSGRAIVESFDSRFKYFPNEQNLGMKKSFNRSLDRSCGEFIVMIADDDPVYPDMLETLLQLTGKYPGHGMYLGGCNWFCTDPDLADFYNCDVG
ncbi:MAG: glycosyltransferase family 2 protein, partial [Flavisolibacter sp.]